MTYAKRLLSIALCFTAMAFLVDSTSAAAFKRVHAGDTAPTFVLPDLDGNLVNLEDYRQGPLTIVTFWALWSPKSAPLLGDLQRLVDEFGDGGLKVKAVAVNAEGEKTPADLGARVRAFVEEPGVKFPILMDKGLEQYNTWGVVATPATAFLAKDLKVVYEFSGHPTSAYQDMRQEVMKALGIEEEVAEAAKPKRERHPASKRVTLNYGLCKTLFERGQLSKAARKLKKVVEEDPGFPDAHALNGAIHLGLARGGKPEAEPIAREAFEKAVELDGTVPLGLAGLAHYALEKEDVAEALDLARKAVSYTEPEDLPDLKPLDGAGAAAAQTDEGSAGTAIAYLDRGAAALKVGNADEAKALVEDVVEGILNIPHKPALKGKGLEIPEVTHKQPQ